MHQIDLDCYPSQQVLKSEQHHMLEEEVIVDIHLADILKEDRLLQMVWEQEVVH